jgi:DUF1680 family protein
VREFERTGVVDTMNSPHARLRPLPYSAVRLTDGFWASWRATNREQALSYGWQKLNESGVISNFEIAAGRRHGAFQNMRFADSDLYKWLEAAAYELGTDGDPELQRRVDEAIELVAAAQMGDGYIDTFYQLGDIEARWTNLRQDHELYCAGHQFQAAVAHYRATGKRSLLDVSCRFADHIDSVFGPKGRRGTPGHPEVEMGLVELFRATGERRYLQLAQFFVDERGQGVIGGQPYHQDHAPVREASEMAGHAVRQLYLMSGLADLFTETGEQPLMVAMERLWEDMTLGKMSITGGVGARYDRESFGESYELPNDRCYNETCAQIASFMWNWRMVLATGEARFADLMEWTLYNGIISGVSMDGKRYFYPNPLMSRGQVERSEWFACACCPPNVMRTLAWLHNAFATTSPEGLQIHLYDQAEIDCALPAAGALTVRMETDYPWSGNVRLTVTRTSDKVWCLSLRIPGWCNGARYRIGREENGRVVGGSYLELRRHWSAGDVVELDLPMEPVFHEAHPYVEPGRGCVALSRGPLVYCLEGGDQDPSVSVLDVAVDPATTVEVENQENLLGGVSTLSFGAYHIDRSEWKNVLYRSWRARETKSTPVRLKAIPYYAWANRNRVPMTVWIPAWPGTG